ncbi:hypothetical protein HJC23_002510 [Cyclotella cryptica]|uniref:Prokaryotic-type class I peptide chain release factors domain-containing protein n=1 Tax=Cyclotella cryptica TaxID=29204 RepID=A0ABD3QY42_9STRA|eukprot:CCRYP_001340-RA/>CCRYP_001340-RA protein AED:0.00 eAED:0.00 QI:117/-1/1/1/-1/1/1/953/485
MKRPSIIIITFSVVILSRETAGFEVGHCQRKVAAVNVDRSFVSRQLHVDPTIHSFGTRLSKQGHRGLLASRSDEASSKSSLRAVDLPSLKRLVQDASSLHDQNLSCTPPIDQIASRLADLETESISDPTFWDASNSARSEVVTRDIARYTKLKDQLERWQKLRNDAEGALELLQDLYQDGEDPNGEMIELTWEECRCSAQALLESSQKYELQTLLSGPYDASPCTLLLTAGAGGTESCDWVDMLYRMYTRHAQHVGYRVTTLDSTPGDVVGYKSVELSIEGDHDAMNPYGWFKGEKGAHRLVRLSPFNANNKRQTTFAGVDVVPILEDEEVKDIEIPEKELEITTMRSGGKGGQNVNKVETGVRIKHLPSGIAVKCTEERSQSQNKQIALSRLKGQLLAIAQEQRLQDINAIRGDIVEASWGAQIRNYVMQPYKLVKDGRSGWETSDVEGFLDGGEVLEECVGSLLRWRRGMEEKEREERDLECP